jgi:hypothetical protein
LTAFFLDTSVPVRERLHECCPRIIRDGLSPASGGFELALLASSLPLLLPIARRDISIIDFPVSIVALWEGLFFGADGFCPVTFFLTHESFLVRFRFRASSLPFGFLDGLFSFLCFTFETVPSSDSDSSDSEESYN